MGEPSPEGERLAGSYEELLEQYLEQEENPFVIEVLTEAVETGSITQAQYDEAHRMYTDCMVNAGYEEEHTRLASGIIQLTPPDLETPEEIDAYMETGSECSDELAPIEALYGTQQGNPDLLANNDEVVVTCLKRSQLVDASYTTSDFRTDLEELFKNASYSPNDPAAQECFSAGGYAIGIEE
ncbi:hypothetical protein [Ruania rhizosphaerae]|uniref:hypothetical protein n=1 Tax=Ruania rhizosphaerae TaxID=1840413 RepID=UPI00135C63E4|nr:hypothetical protein [Ruania rhizosphaerae]